SCVGIGIDLQERKACRAEQICGNLIARVARTEVSVHSALRITFSRQEWVPRPRICQRSTKIAELLRCGGDITGDRRTAILKAPLFRQEEKGPVLHYRTTKVAAEVVVLQMSSRLVGFIKEEIVQVKSGADQEL